MKSKNIYFQLFLVKTDPTFQDLHIFVKAIKPKTYFEAKVRLQRLLDPYCYQASHVIHYLI